MSGESSIASRRSLGGALSQRMQQSQQDERRRALRALLKRPLLGATGSDTELHSMVRRHERWLRQWLDHNTGWRLQVDSELARLHKLLADTTDATRGATAAPSDEPLDRRRLMIFCLCLAALQEDERQTVLGRLAERVAELSASDEIIAGNGLTIDLSLRNDRRDLVQAVRLLLDYGVLAQVDGDEEKFIRQEGDVLYNIHRAALVAMLAVRRGPSTITEQHFDDRMSKILFEADPDTEEGRNRRLRWDLTRRLLDDPVTYYADLTEPEFQYLTRQRPRLLREIEQATGLIPEVRNEGIAMVDVSGGLTDLDMPEEGTDGHAALLVAEWLADRARARRDDPQAGRIEMREVESYLRSLIKIHRQQQRHWRQGVEVEGYECVMAEQIVLRLEALRLIERDGSSITPRPAIARYAVDESVKSPMKDDERTDLWTSPT
jgi:uncharacterized protein (TIGR02678 family)